MHPKTKQARKNSGDIPADTNVDIKSTSNSCRPAIPKAYKLSPDPERRPEGNAAMNTHAKSVVISLRTMLQGRPQGLNTTL